MSLKHVKIVALLELTGKKLKLSPNDASCEPSQSEGEYPELECLLVVAGGGDPWNLQARNITFFFKKLRKFKKNLNFGLFPDFMLF